ncbi:hypothetical membrane protein (DUF4149 domain) [Campylobacter fetus subsp. venerealis 97/608]|uniref:DUF4149 domain-containing protein n=1 Tax=Campylobacter fetus TaxID=196 RepID=UPI0005090F42|nr:DUF4149 domain-containing protein [Campylobacter fetus]AIR80240.1 hypothetical membrane protein (DUF4149 domain) [Campylobacter fetus subsp. venerealis 97/608]
MKRIKDLYLFLLGICIGVEIAIGAFLAPIVFFPTKYIGEGVLTHFQSGQLMTQVFLKYNILLLIVCAFCVIYEIINLIKNKDEVFNFKFSTFMLSLINVILGASFVFYFTDYIVNAQNMGAEATQTAAFASVHKVSEVVMKIMMLAQALLFFMRAYFKR